MNPYSITSNEAKLFKHMPELIEIQQGKPSPVLLHVSLTNKCNSNCVHCCFSKRDKTLELDYDYVIDVVNQFAELGIKSLEFTGGGEPTMYPYIDDIIYHCYMINVRIGMNTNALNIGNVSNYNLLDWCRVALNAFDLMDNEKIEKFKENVAILKNSTKVTACYIVAKEIGIKNIEQVIEFSNEQKIHTRIAPDCIQDFDGIKNTIKDIKDFLSEHSDNKYCFCSDFNVYLDSRPDNICYIHYIKPFLFTDGNIYACPSSELNVKYQRDMDNKFKICEGSDALEYYTNKLKPMHYDCKYCKYALQNNIINSILMETEDNAFL